MSTASKRLYCAINPSSRDKYFDQDCFRRILDAYAVDVADEGKLTEDEVSARLGDVEVILTGWGGCNITVANLDAAPALKLIACFGGSVTHLSPLTGMERGITYINCAAGMVDAMAEATIGMMLALGYQMVYADQRLRQRHDWGHDYPLSTGLAEKTVGIIGLGHIGRAVAGLLPAFRARPLGFDPYVVPDRGASACPVTADLDDLLRRSDIITIHAGWTEETTGMIGPRELSLLHDGALVINNARTKIVDERALLDECRAGRLAAAINLIPLDTEIYGADDLRDLPNLLFTSGATNVSDVYTTGMSRMITEELLRYARGEPLLHVVTREWVEHTT